MKNHFLEIVRYNLWANSKIIELLLQQEAVLLRKEIVNSFDSLQKTLYHIWDAQVVWLYRIGGGEIEYFPSSKLEEPIEEYCQKMIAHCEDWVTYLEQQPESFFNSTCKYTTLSGEAKEETVYQIIHHCMNHSTYHRGQLITLAKQLGVKKTVSTDYIFYRYDVNESV